MIWSRPPRSRRPCIGFSTAHESLLDAYADLLDPLTRASERDALEPRNLAERIQRTERAIETFPCAAFYNQAEDYFERYVPRTRVIFIYRIVTDEVLVIAAFHTSRDPGGKPRGA